MILKASPAGEAFLPPTTRLGTDLTASGFLAMPYLPRRKHNMRKLLLWLVMVAL